MNAATWLALACSMGVSAPVGGQSECFPAQAALDSFRAAWYCKHLRAAGLGRLEAHQAFRFTYLPSFDAPRIVTVSPEGQGAIAVGVVLGGKGGYDPGQVVKTTRRVLTGEAWRLLLQRLENAGMWEATDTADRVGVDGARWILEGRWKGQYRLHDVWSPDTSSFPQYLKVCAYMLDLAQINPGADDLY